MKDVRVTGSIRARTWTGVISPTGENSFAAWIVSRWTPPDQVRRTSPQRDFRAAGRSGTWFALSAYVLQPSWHMTLAFGSKTWTRVTHHFDLRRTISHLISVAYGAVEFLRRTALLQIAAGARSFFPTTILSNRVSATQQSYSSFYLHLPPQVAVSNASSKSSVRRAQETLPGTMLARTFFHHLVPARMKIDQIWQRDSWQSSSALRMFESRTVLRTTATQTVTTRKQSAGPMHVLAVHARRLHFALMKSNH